MKPSPFFRQKKYLLPALLIGAILTYAGIAAFTGTCPICTLTNLFKGNQTSTSSEATGVANAPIHWKVKDLTGHEITSESLHGKVVILDFWATWCPPCQQEIPGFVELNEKYRDKGLVVIGVSMDEDPSVVPSFIRDFHIDYPIALGGPAFLEFFPQFNGNLPTTFIFDKKGNLITSREGYESKENFESLVTPLL